MDAECTRCFSAPDLYQAREHVDVPRSPAHIRSSSDISSLLVSRQGKVIERENERKRKRKRERERDREIQRERERETERDRDRERAILK